MLVAHEPIYLANYPTDMRRGINGLMLMIHNEFGMNPTDGAYYVFSNRARDRLKVLYWDTNGFALWMKRLEKSRFKFEYLADSRVKLSADEFSWLLSGLPWYKTRGNRAEHYSIFA